MAVTYQNPVYSGLTVTMRWSSSLGSPPTGGYRLYKNGALVASGVSVEEWTVLLQVGETLVFEVLDDPDLEPATAFPGRITLGWRRVSDAAQYRIEEYVDAAWVQRRVYSDTGEEWLRWDSRFLEDVTTHQFRIIPVAENGNDGTPVSFSVLMVRNPDVPFDDSEVMSRFSYDSETQKVTIAAS